MSEEEHRLWLKQQEELTNEALRPVHILEGPVDRAIIPSILHDAGVPHVIRGGPMDSFHVALTAQHGWGVVLVPEEDVTRARDVIRTYLESTVPEDPPSDET
jgi:hypothetical protein